VGGAALVALEEYTIGTAVRAGRTSKKSCLIRLSSLVRSDRKYQGGKKKEKEKEETQQKEREEKYGGALEGEEENPDWFTIREKNSQKDNRRKDRAMWKQKSPLRRQNCSPDERKHKKRKGRRKPPRVNGRV